MFLIQLVMLAQAVSGSGTTDFGERIVPGSGVGRIAPPPRMATAPARTPLRSGGPLAAGTSLTEAVQVARGLGRVTSTLRSPEHNRAVGGVPNSYHLRGRAIDIVRAPGVSHQALTATFRNAGFQLVESLDEGDHSHVAFAWGQAHRPSLINVVATSAPIVAAVHWKWISAPGAQGSRNGGHTR